MNEVSIKLAEQAGLYGVDNKHQYDSTDISNSLLEKYTDLIIRECMDAVRTVDKTHGVTTYDITVIENTKQKCENSIRKRFGYIVN
jgi:hypothetical protein